MNTVQETLWANLVKLTRDVPTFYAKDFVRDGVTYRVFNYRHATHEDFQRPSALECRGIMFEVSGNAPVRLVSWPPEKFFNWNENPYHEEVDFNEVESIYEKADGSLISTYNHLGEVRLKSKGSLNSEHALAAEHIIENDDVLKKALTRLVCDVGVTVNMEYTSQEHQIVLVYDKPSLVILNVRDNETGEYVSKETVISTPGAEKLAKYWVKEYDHSKDFNFDTAEQFAMAVRDMVDIEGFIIKLKDRQIKLKTEWYVKRHSVVFNSKKQLFFMVVEGISDDVRMLLSNNDPELESVRAMEQLVRNKFNEIYIHVDTFYKDYKYLTVKDFALMALDTFKRDVFNIVMATYKGKDLEESVNAYLIKNYREYIYSNGEEEEEECDT